MRLQSDGKAVIVGRTGDLSSHSDMGCCAGVEAHDRLARYNEGGSVHTRFGGTYLSPKIFPMRMDDLVVAKRRNPLIMKLTCNAMMYFCPTNR